METINGIVCHRSDTEENYITNSTIPYAGEICFATDTKVLKVGDGTSTWAELPISSNIYRKYANMSFFQPSGVGQAVTMYGDPMVAVEALDITQGSGAANGPDGIVAGVWVEDDVTMGMEGLVQLSGVCKLKAHPNEIIEAGTPISQGPLRIAATVGIMGLGVSGGATGADGFTIRPTLDPADDIYIEILSTDTQDDIFDKLSAVEIDGWSGFANPSPDYQVFWMANAPGQRLALLDNPLTADDGDGWFDPMGLMIMAGTNNLGAQVATGSFALVEATCPADGTISVTLPSETAITRVCTTGDTRADVYADLITNCPANYEMFIRGDRLYYYANVYADETTSLVVSAGDTGWSLSGDSVFTQSGSLGIEEFGAKTARTQSRIFGMALSNPDDDGMIDVLLKFNNRTNALGDEQLYSSSTVVATAANIPYFVSGTEEITTIESYGIANILIFLPTGAWTLATGGNIATASQAVVGKPMLLVYSNQTELWYPSY